VIAVPLIEQLGELALGELQLQHLVQHREFLNRPEPRLVRIDLVKDLFEADLLHAHHILEDFY
jgi:hypothetical protein